MNHDDFEMNSELHKSADLLIMQNFLHLSDLIFKIL